jgi:hypothetical protein
METNVDYYVLVGSPGGSMSSVLYLKKKLLILPQCHKD